MCANAECDSHSTTARAGYFVFMTIVRRVGAREAHSVLHFWLCAKCAEIYTLDTRQQIAGRFSLERRSEEVECAVRPRPRKVLVGHVVSRTKHQEESVRMENKLA